MSDGKPVSAPGSCPGHAFLTLLWHKHRVASIRVSRLTRRPYSRAPRHGRGRMNNYLLLAVCFLLGMALRRSGRLPDNAAAALNGFVVHISLPALTLSYVHGLDLDMNLILPALMAWI